MGRACRILLCSLVMAAVAAAPVVTAQITATNLDLARDKAAFVLNFARYAAWPQSSFWSAVSPIVIGVAGDDSVAAYLEVLAEGETVDGRPIVVAKLDLSSLEEDAEEGERSALAGRLRSSHLVFIGVAAQGRMDWLLERLAGEDILTVSDVHEFAERGGMIGLVMRNRRLGFDANVQRIGATRVSLSSQLLRLARIVGNRSS